MLGTSTCHPLSEPYQHSWIHSIILSRTAEVFLALSGTRAMDCYNQGDTKTTSHTIEYRVKSAFIMQRDFTDPSSPVITVRLRKFTYKLLTWINGLITERIQTSSGQCHCWLGSLEKRGPWMHHWSQSRRTWWDLNPNSTASLALENSTTEIRESAHPVIYDWTPVTNLFKA